MTIEPELPPAARHSAPAERNRAPILAQLQRLLPPSGVALEIAAGTGQHAAHFAAALPHWRWHPTDGDEASLASIDAWCARLPNVSAAQLLDVTRLPWSGVPAAVDLVYAANLVHIAPWAVSGALMRGAAAALSARGLLVTYGPYLVDGVETAPGNVDFDRSLRQRNPDWGLRQLAELQAEAAAAGLALRESVGMPANNRLLVWARAG